MAEVVWSEPALADLDAIADYIALDNPEAARKLVQRVFGHVDQLERHPDSESALFELPDSRYRQIVEPPCRVIYRQDKRRGRLFTVHVMRHEQRRRYRNLARK